MKRDKFLEKCRSMRCVEEINFNRGKYTVSLKENWYSYWRGDFVTFTYYNLTTMDMVEYWLSSVYFISKDMKEYTMKLITEIENAKSRIVSIESNIRIYERKLEENKKYLEDEKSRLDKLNIEFYKNNKVDK